MFVQHAEALSTKTSVKARPGFWRLCAAACSVTLSACSWILIARLLAPGAFGVYTFVLWLATVGTPIIGIGMSTLTSRYLASIQSGQKPRLAAGVFSFVWRQQYRHILIYCLIYVALAFPLSWLYGAYAPLLLLLLAGLITLPLLLSGVAGITLRSLWRFDLLAVIRLVDVVVLLLLLIIVTQTIGAQIETFLLLSAASSALALGMALIGIVRLLPMRHAIQPGPLLKQRLTRGASNSFSLFILDAIVWQRSEVLLIAYWGHSSDLGFYALGSLISAYLMTIPPLLLSTCALPLLLRFFPAHRYKNAAHACFRMSCYVAALSLSLCALAFFTCPFFITFCLGDAYLPLVTPLRILLVPAAIGSVATVSMTQLAQSDRRKTLTWLGMGAATLNIALAPPCILHWGISGAALASASAQTVSAIGSILLCKRMMSHR